MRFLVDAQLPRGLVTYLRRSGHHAQHVNDVGLGEAEDIVILRFAFQQRAALITKDQDFVRLLTTVAEAPQIVWLRIGNNDNRGLWQTFDVVLEDVIKALQSGDQVIEIR